MNEQIKDKTEQLGFTSNSSTQHAIFIVREISKHYLKKNKNVWICSIDSFKAFDRVWRNGLLYKLIPKSQQIDWRMLKMYYDVVVCYIAYGDEVTSIFKTKTGVKQGGTLSPKLYNAYIADIVVKINEVQDGVFIGDIKLNIIIYADDILLLSNTKVGMAKMLNKLLVYMVMWKIVINWHKTNYLLVGKTKLLISPVLVEGIEVKRVKEIKYLGFHIN